MGLTSSSVPRRQISVCDSTGPSVCIFFLIFFSFSIKQKMRTHKKALVPILKLLYPSELTISGWLICEILSCGGGCSSGRSALYMHRRIGLSEA